MALADLNRSNDTPIATLKLSTIVPRDFPTNPAVIGSLADANPNAVKPRYSGAGAAADWQGSAYGDDVDVSAANTPNVDLNNKAVANYAPRNQAGKAALMVPPGALAVDVARGRGWIAPYQPYVGNGAVPVAPVVSSISPATGAAASLPMLVTITGTGFSPWSTVYTGGSNVPEASAKYISPTQMTVPIWAAAPGTVSVAVEDHNMLSNVDKLFTVT